MAESTFFLPVLPVLTSIATRIAGMAGRQVDEPAMLTGGAALVPSMAQGLSAMLGIDVAVVPDPQLTGALGAALLAAEE